LLEAVVSLNLATWGEEVYNGRLPALQQRIGAWLAESPPGQPVAIEPRGCPTPGACSCVEPPAPDPDPSDFQAFQGIALDMVESLRPIVIPEILGVLRKAIKSTGQPAPAADGEREELASALEVTGSHEIPSYEQLRRAAALLRQPAPAPAPVPVAERPWEREGWCDAEGRCWLLTTEDEYPQWRLHSVEGHQPGGSMIWVPVDSTTGAMVDTFYASHSLPHWAIPLPQPPQGGDVAE
jgi:hypothetical protein